MTKLIYDTHHKLWKEGNAVFRQIGRQGFRNQVAKAKISEQVDMKDRAAIRRMLQGFLDYDFVISGSSDKELRVTKVWYAYSRKMQYEIHVHLKCSEYTGRYSVEVYSHEYFRSNDKTTLYGYKYAPVMDYKRGAQTLDSTQLFKEETVTTDYDRIPTEVELLQAVMKELRGENKVKESTAQVELYVDGSWSSNTPEVTGWGFAAVHPTRLVESTGNKKVLAVRYGTAPADNQQIGGELKATMSAIKWAKEKGAKRVAVYYDYAGIEKWATGEWKAKKVLPKAYTQWIQKQMKELDVQFVKVKSNTGNQYNDLADNLAKEAITKAQVSQ